MHQMQTTSPPARRGSRAFSLVELLVVISIIAVLIALLLPSLGQARLVTFRITCQNQMRQLALGSSTYSHDFHYWFQSTYPVSHGGLSTIAGQDVLELGYWGSSTDLLTCPDTEYQGNIVGYGPPAFNTSLKQRWLTYRVIAASGLSTQTWHFFGTHPSASGLQPKRNDNKVSTAVPNADYTDMMVTDPTTGNRKYIHPPAMQPMYIDGMKVGDTRYFVYTSAQNAYNTNNHHRLGGINVIFLDGHAIWADQSQGEPRMGLGYAGGDSGWLRW